ncbi:hypothetical protein Ddc_00191 [Ditylenchus destructor]|nr:hypothetical protein Ddc_00191 [Ditylenchus destructor]
MVVECASLCLLAIAVGLKASYDTEKCSYCMDVRGLTSECDADPISCMSSEPDALIYCLTVHESPRHSDHIRRVVRCLSHAAFNITTEDLHDAMALRECHFDTMKKCHCSTCRPRRGHKGTDDFHPRQIFSTKNEGNKTIDSSQNAEHNEDSSASVLFEKGRPKTLKTDQKFPFKEFITTKELSKTQTINTENDNHDYLSSIESTLDGQDLPISSPKERSSEESAEKFLLKSLHIHRSALPLQDQNGQKDESVIKREREVLGSLNSSNESTNALELSTSQNLSNSPSSAICIRNISGYNFGVAFICLNLCIFNLLILKIV